MVKVKDFKKLRDMNTLEQEISESKSIHITTTTLIGLHDSGAQKKGEDYTFQFRLNDEDDPTKSRAFEITINEIKA